ncbi:MAG: 16S rRNA (cytidine(1402)-2'-O)-methyltransferase [Acidobacteria bacterium]|nr:16S rRNA (cytidine(1402)-2'-O)-methyltransferase [Acidobacteriota bacterium]
MRGIIYLVATPIGNLKDISLRALDILSTVDAIACEDTRHTGKLLNHFELSSKLISFHEHNEHSRIDELIELVDSGKSIAVVSDAGTPGIADPGFRLVKKAIERGITVSPIPGPAAFVSAVIISGLPTDSIFFGGFLPSRKGERLKRLIETATIPATLCFYESPHRIAKSLEDCAQALGDRRVAVIRELTKIHEEVICGNLFELSAQFKERITKGEIVLVIDRNRAETNQPGNSASLASRVEELELGGIDAKKALKQASKEFGVSRSEAYRLLQAEKDR